MGLGSSLQNELGHVDALTLSAYKCLQQFVSYGFCSPFLLYLGSWYSQMQCHDVPQYLLRELLQCDPAYQDVPHLGQVCMVEKGEVRL